MADHPSRFEWERAMRGAHVRLNLRVYLMTLATYMNADGSDCFPSADTVADDLGVERGTVFEWQKEAVGAGWLVVHSKKGQASGKGGRGRTNLYEPSIPDVTPSGVGLTVSASTQSGAHLTVSKSTQSGVHRPHSRVATGHTVGWPPDVTTQDQTPTTPAGSRSIPAALINVLRVEGITSENDIARLIGISQRDHETDSPAGRLLKVPMHRKACIAALRDEQATERRIRRAAEPKCSCTFTISECDEATSRQPDRCDPALERWAAAEGRSA